MRMKAIVKAGNFSYYGVYERRLFAVRGPLHPPQVIDAVIDEEGSWNNEVITEDEDGNVVAGYVGRITITDWSLLEPRDYSVISWIIAKPGLEGQKLYWKSENLDSESYAEILHG